jgi:hypothetical protein
MDGAGACTITDVGGMTTTGDGGWMAGDCMIGAMCWIGAAFEFALASSLPGTDG